MAVRGVCLVGKEFSGLLETGRVVVMFSTTGLVARGGA